MSSAESPSTDARAFARAVGIAGGQSPFSRKTGISQQRVSYRLKKGLNLPGEFVRIASLVTGVPKEELRPDLYPLPHPSRRGTTTMVDRGQHQLFTADAEQ